ncbi:MAG: hypothetical protein LKG27_03980 [Clostridiaceae bacterium]|jgi:hypothetical protein|nr:hypothetical protein [Clostridiaceae bacterium]
MIKSTTLKLKKSDTVLDNIKIEKALSNMGYEPIRWAITEVDEDFYTINLSYDADF